MSATRALARERPPQPRVFRSIALDVALALVLPLLLVGLTGAFDMPARIDRLTVVNPTDYDVIVEVAGAEGGGWLTVSSVERGTTAVVGDVVDQGGTWRFRIRGQGRAGGVVELRRAELASDGWRFTVPPEVGARLERAGAPPSPP